MRCAGGHRHWGRFGAAGLLLSWLDDTRQPWVLLQHRAGWSHHGGTWGLPGGARRAGETAEATARREAAEEVDVALAGVVVMHEYLDDHGGWTYVTVAARTPRQLPVRAAALETIDARWVPIDEVVRLPLHPGFAASWPALVEVVRSTHD